MIILFTVYRRYQELEISLHLSRQFQHELGGPPRRILLWAAPEVGRLHFIRDLLDQGLLDEVLTRPELPQEGRATSFLESRNIRQGLNYIAEHFPGVPVIVQAADIQILPGTYGLIAEQLKTFRAVVFCWDGLPYAWHTNLFGLSDFSLKPPVLDENCPDVLESAWARPLLSEEGIFRWHNSREQRFLHRHLSETLPSVPYINESLQGDLPLHTRGHRTWGQFWKKLFLCIFP